MRNMTLKYMDAWSTDLKDEGAGKKKHHVSIKDKGLPRVRSANFKFYKLCNK